MRTTLFILAATVSLILGDHANAQVYVPPLPGGVAITPDYAAPGNRGYTAPGYQWREQRANDDWRNNTWREQRINEDWRNNNWRTQRANEDWQQREGYAKDRTPNNAADRGYVECGSGSVGSSIPCRTNTKDTTRNNAMGTKNGDGGYAECGANSVVEACRSRSPSVEPPAPVKQVKRPEAGVQKKD